MLDANLSRWLDEQAGALDCGQCDAEAVLPQLAAAGVLRLGVPKALGGEGGHVVDALRAVADVASHSLTAAFVFWGQRAFIEYLLQGDNPALSERLLPTLLSGEQAGATGLSNAMKYLSGIEALGVTAVPGADGWTLNGRLPWVTNLRKSGFVVAAAIDLPGAQPFVAAFPGDLAGVERSEDLQLLGLQSSNTAALQLHQAQLQREWLIAADARRFLPQVRPAFLGLQCGLSIGLAQRALAEVRGALAQRSILHGEYEQLASTLSLERLRLEQGLLDGTFLVQPSALFALRIELAERVAEALQLELQASGGRAYLHPHGDGFARRWRESAFVPVVTPSLVQLRAELQKKAAQVSA